MVERIGSISPFSLAVDEGVGICRSSCFPSGGARRLSGTGEAHPKTCVVDAG